MNPRRSQPGRNTLCTGFTLIELLVVIAIISLLVSILLPSLTKAKDLAKQVVCMNNMKQIGMAFAYYLEDSDGVLPPGYAAVTIAPWPDYLGKESWNNNGKDIFWCPSDISPREDLRLSYRANHWWMNWTSDNPPTVQKYKRIQNPNEKLAILEGSFRGHVKSDGGWDGNEQVIMHQYDMAFLPPEFNGIDNRHNDGANYLWFDWHVTWEDPYPRDEKYWRWE